MQPATSGGAASCYVTRAPQALPQGPNQRWSLDFMAGAGLNEEVFASLAEARAIVERWRQEYNQFRPHSAHGGLTPEAVYIRSAGDRLRAPEPLRRSPAANEVVQALCIHPDSH